MTAALATCLMSSVATADDAPVPVGAPAAPAPVVSGDAIVVPSAAPIAGYGHEGTFEAGASAGLAIGQGSQGFSVTPSIGKFIGDNFAMTAMMDVTTLFAGGASATSVAALIEPSLHVPFKPTMSGFIGMGIGASYVSPLGTAIAVAPHLGMNILIGKSGILRPSLTYMYTTHDPMAAAGKDGTTNVTYVAIASAVRFNIGYLKAW